MIAREISVPGETLHQFAHPSEKLKALCEYLYGNHVTYDAELDLLKTTNATPPQRMSAYPPPWDPTKYQPPKHPTSGPVPEKKPPPPQKRAGWV